MSSGGEHGTWISSTGKCVTGLLGGAKPKSNRKKKKNPIKKNVTSTNTNLLVYK